MQLDDELCLCFHVTKRKVINFLAIEKPKRVGQMSDCFGAGTGCGWCRPYLRRLFEAAHQGAAGPATSAAPPAEEPTAAQYAQGRSAYVRSGGGVPPAGATPIEPPPPVWPP